MAIHELTSTMLPDAGKPYAPGTACGTLIFVSGQVPVNAMGELVGAGDIKSQTDQVLRNVSHVLAAGGASISDVTKVTVFLTDLANYSGMNAVFSQWFAAPRPARSTIKVDLIDPGYLVEIEAIAVAPN